MKRYNLHIITFIIGLFLLSACQDEELIKKSTVIEGVHTTVQLAYETSFPKIVETKAALEKEDESRVHNLYVLVFNNTSGCREFGKLFKQDELNNISFEITSGEKRIYAVANVDDESPITTFNKNLSEIASIDELKQMVASLSQDNFYRGSGKLLMSGYFVGKEENKPEGYCNIMPDQEKVALMSIKLKRMDARVTFNIGLAEEASVNKRFTPKKWQIKNLPKQAYLFDGEGSVSQDLKQYFGTEFANFETANSTTGMSSFTYYMMENAYTNPDCIEYVMREKEHKDESGKNAGYIYAPETSTYVVLTGDYYEKYNEGGIEKERTAEVSYTIHLGFVDEKPDDFKAERNTTYIYNVYVQSVDNIRLEVTSYTEGGKLTSEVQPGAEGEIVESDQFFQYDSHYEQSIISFKKDALGGKAGVKISTPYDKGYYVLGGEEASGLTQPIESAKDLDWVHFIKNEGNNKTTFAEYKPESVISVKKLLEQLKDGTAFNGDSEVTYTMFIDEFYYTKNPTTGDAISTEWKNFVNKPDRTMFILCNTQHSEDGESSLTTSSVAISQRSIKTFYNESAGDDLKTAWGTETVNETGKIEPGNTNPWNKSGLDKQNGRWNFFTQANFGGNRIKSWNTYITYTVNENNKRNHMKTDLTKANQLLYSCLQRNRDENGDGDIDPTEVKWYPAAINQLTDLWMGKDALPSEAHLYPNGYNDYWRYLSSDGKELYAEEGSSINKWKFLWANSIMGKDKPNEYDYRCVRNLGMTDGKPVNIEDYPQDYVQRQENGFALTYMSSASVRGKADFQNGEFAVHNELSPSNRPYLAFEYKNEFVGENKSWKDGNSLVTSGKSPCNVYNKNGETGWRVPNQRELALMVSRCDLSSWGGQAYAQTRTSSSLSAKKQKGLGYLGGISEGAPYMAIPDNNYTGPVRCVKDIATK